MGFLHSGAANGSTICACICLPDRRKLRTCDMCVALLVSLVADGGAQVDGCRRSAAPIRGSD